MTSKLRRITNEFADEFRQHFERDPEKDDPMFLGKLLRARCARLQENKT